MDFQQEQGGGTSPATSYVHPSEYYLYKKLKLDSFLWQPKDSRGAASVGSTVLQTSSYNLSNISKWQLGATAQTWQQYLESITRKEDWI